MMSWTLDFLLMNDPKINIDRTEDWENEIEKRESPKIKFPVVATSENLEKFVEDFRDPQIQTPREKKNINSEKKVFVVDLDKKKKIKKGKPKLF